MSKLDALAWIDLQKILDVIRHPQWKWHYAANSDRVKYIELRVDTRDGHCLMRDNKGKRLTLDELAAQIDSPGREVKDLENMIGFDEARLVEHLPEDVFIGRRRLSDGTVMWHALDMSQDTGRLIAHGSWLPDVIESLNNESS